MKVPQRKLLRFLLFFSTELISFFIICINFRALARGFYFWTAGTDMLISFQKIILAKIFVEDEKARDWVSIAGVTLGGATGSVLSIFLTRHLFGG